MVADEVPYDIWEKVSQYLDNYDDLLSLIHTCQTTYKSADSLWLHHGYHVHPMAQKYASWAMSIPQLLDDPTYIVLLEEAFQTGFLAEPPNEDNEERRGDYLELLLDRTEDIVASQPKSAAFMKKLIHKQTIISHWVDDYSHRTLAALKYTTPDAFIIREGQDEAENVEGDGSSYAASYRGSYGGSEGTSNDMNNRETWALKTHVPPSSFYDRTKADEYGLIIEGPSETERGRIERAFWKWEFFSRLFLPRRITESEYLPPLYNAENAADFLREVEPWEKEEMTCIYTYLIQRVDSIFEDERASIMHKALTAADCSVMPRDDLEVTISRFRKTGLEAPDEINTALKQLWEAASSPSSKTTDTRSSSDAPPSWTRTRKDLCYFRLPYLSRLKWVDNWAHIGRHREVAADHRRQFDVIVSQSLDFLHDFFRQERRRQIEISQELYIQNETRLSFGYILCGQGPCDHLMGHDIVNHDALERELEDEPGQAGAGFDLCLDREDADHRCALFQQGRYLEPEFLPVRRFGYVFWDARRLNEPEVRKQMSRALQLQRGFVDHHINPWARVPLRYILEHLPVKRKALMSILGDYAGGHAIPKMCCHEVGMGPRCAGHWATRHGAPRNFYGHDFTSEGSSEFDQSMLSHSEDDDDSIQADPVANQPDVKGKGPMVENDEGRGRWGMLGPALDARESASSRSRPHEDEKSDRKSKESDRKSKKSDTKSKEIDRKSEGSHSRSKTADPKPQGSSSRGGVLGTDIETGESAYGQTRDPTATRTDSKDADKEKKKKKKERGCLPCRTCKK